MDAFYASVEQRDNPELQGKPIAVGGGEKRGVTTTASYEARKYGVKSAMPGYLAKSKCPDIIFVKPRFSVYKEVSQQIREIFQKYTDLVEPLSLDEAYLDVTINKKNIEYASEVAQEIRKKVFETTQLTCSAGVSYCKFIAKIASDINKPDGITIIKPKQAIPFLEKLSINRFYGVGKVTAKKMNQLGIFNGSDLKTHDRAFLSKHFGKSGSFYYDIVRGIDNRPVNTDNKRKSVGVEHTLNENISDVYKLKKELINLSEKLFKRIQVSKFQGRTITLKIKNAKFKIITRSKSILYPIDSIEIIQTISTQLLEDHFDEFDEVRLIGLNISNELNQTKQSNQIVLDF